MEQPGKATPEQKFVNVSLSSKEGDGFGNLIKKGKIRKILEKFQQMNSIICELLQNETTESKNLSE
jgi:hypothetical protein